MSLRRMAEGLNPLEWPENAKEAHHMVSRAVWHVRSFDRLHEGRMLAREILVDAGDKIARELEIAAWAA